MTKINKLLVTTLLASSAVTFSAQASDTEWGWGDTEAWVSDYNSNKQMVVRDSRVDEVFVDPAKINVFETNDVHQVELVVNSSNATPPRVKSKTKYINSKYFSETPKNLKLAIDFGKSAPVERTRKDGTKVTYMIDISKPLTAEYTRLATLNAQDLKDALTNEAGKSKAARVADVLKLEMQTEILNARALQQAVATKEMEFQLASILASQEAINAAYKTRKAMIATDDEYTTALIKADAENREKLAAMKSELEAQVTGFNYGAPLPAVENAVATAPNKDEVKVPVTYTPINRDALNLEALNYRFEECSVISDADLTTIEAKKAELLKQGIAANKALAAKIDAAVTALDYNFKAAVWDKYKAAVTEARNPKPVAEAVAVEAEAKSADDALSLLEEKK